ncbi:hypothetical protein GMES_3354 [Paraglaciecola mesophila KMM 241]|uniref:Uncharacterized protein n=1 Tax=Paraglaciecola mesophila KMM 241 TaxID=1128912 RepID=K6Z5G1_9ALTE|nr:hypothetical protein GMES_3354 [Paraglaciecola mesophila KMM 241]
MPAGLAAMTKQAVSKGFCCLTLHTPIKLYAFIKTVGE